MNDMGELMSYDTCILGGQINIKQILMNKFNNEKSANVMGAYDRLT